MRRSRKRAARSSATCPTTTSGCRATSRRCGGSSARPTLPMRYRSGSKATAGSTTSASTSPALTFVSCCSEARAASRSRAAPTRSRSIAVCPPGGGRRRKTRLPTCTCGSRSSTFRRYAPSAGPCRLCSNSRASHARAGARNSDWPNSTTGRSPLKSVCGCSARSRPTPQGQEELLATRDDEIRRVYANVVEARPRPRASSWRRIDELGAQVRELDAELSERGPRAGVPLVLGHLAHTGAHGEPARARGRAQMGCEGSSWRSSSRSVWLFASRSDRRADCTGHGI